MHGPLVQTQGSKLPQLLNACKTTQAGKAGHSNDPSRCSTVVMAGGDDAQIPASWTQAELQYSMQQPQQLLSDLRTPSNQASMFRGAHITGMKALAVLLQGRAGARGPDSGGQGHEPLQLPSYGHSVPHQQSRGPGGSPEGLCNSAAHVPTEPRQPMTCSLTRPHQEHRLNPCCSYLGVAVCHVLEPLQDVTWQDSEGSAYYAARFR